MFSVGQRVWHRRGQHSGKVLECEGERVFIEQDNGSEMDFPASDLTTTPPAAAKAFVTEMKGARQAVTQAAAPAAVPAARMVPTRTLKPADITTEHARVLGVVPVRTLQAVASVFERKSGGRKFSSLDIAEKLNVIADITAVPFRMMRQYSDRPGELGLLMGKGLADSQKAD